MKKIISLTLALILCAGIFISCGKKSDYEQIKKAGKLVIGITIYDPMNFYEADGTTLTGFDTDFAKAVCAKLGFEPVFQIIDWDAKETLLKSGDIDCIWNGLTVKEDRRENMDFTKTYLTNKQCVVIKKSDADKFTSKESLEGALMTAEKDSAGEAAILEDPVLKKASYTSSAAQSNALIALKSGNFDAIVIDYTMARANTGKGDYADLMIVESISLKDEEYAIGFRIGSDMTAKVNAIIDELIADGTLAAIAAKYDLVDLYEAAVK